MNTMGQMMGSVVAAGIFTNFKDKALEAILAIFITLVGWKLLREFGQGQVTKIVMTIIIAGMVMFVMMGPEIVGEWMRSAYNAIK